MQFSHMIGDIFDCIDKAGALYVAQSYHHLAAALSPSIYLGVTLYIGFQFLSAMRGMTTYDAMLMDCLRIVAILTFALNYDWFCLFVYDLFTKEPLYIFKAVATNGQHVENIKNALDSYFDTGLSYVSKIFLQGSWSNPTYYLFGAIFFIVVLLMNAAAAVLIILAKVASTVLLALSPLFIFLALYASTNDIFNSYLRQLFTYALIPILTCMVLSITFSVTDLALQYMHSKQIMTITAIVPYLFSCLIQIYLLAHVKGKASAMAAGFSLKALIPTLKEYARNAQQGASSMGLGVAAAGAAKLLSVGASALGRTLGGEKASKDQASQQVARNRVTKYKNKDTV